jgi:hypothetical protein
VKLKFYSLFNKYGLKIFLFLLVVVLRFTSGSQSRDRSYVFMEMNII